ncbi:hypothetical protein D088_790050 [Salmonella enterica subsp. houtenae serovar 16:z4,z32:-- str. RKS3027]|nr:hypothetical protein D088_790050 [Salmonella enterica subsp. houtenae serovar 16:z4,z32:-- str. RKS3027]
MIYIKNARSSATYFWAAIYKIMFQRKRHVLRLGDMTLLPNGTPAALPLRLVVIR